MLRRHLAEFPNPPVLGASFERRQHLGIENEVLGSLTQWINERGKATVGHGEKGSVRGNKRFGFPNSSLVLTEGGSARMWDGTLSYSSMQNGKSDLEPWTWVQAWVYALSGDMPLSWVRNLYPCLLQFMVLVTVLLLLSQQWWWELMLWSTSVPRSLHLAYRNKISSFLRLKIVEVSYFNCCLNLARCALVSCFFFPFETWSPATCYLDLSKKKKKKGQRNVNSVGRTAEFSILMPVGDTDRVGPWAQLALINR